MNLPNEPKLLLPKDDLTNPLGAPDAPIPPIARDSLVNPLGNPILPTAEAGLTNPLDSPNAPSPPLIAADGLTNPLDSPDAPIPPIAADSLTTPLDSPNALIPPIAADSLTTPLGAPDEPIKSNRPTEPTLATSALDTALQSPTETWTLSPLASPDDEHVHQIWNEIDALIKSGGISDTIICEGRQLLYCKYGAWKRTNSIIQTSFMQNLASKVGLKYRECADRALTIRGHRFRVNTLLTKGKYKAVLRLLPSKILSPEEIGIPEHVVDLSVTARVGIILVVGVTGSGKSSTVAALLNNRGKNNAEHIITLEDPIEYLYPEDSPAEFTQREIGTDVPSFEKGLRAALREAPQIIFVGEIRDKETAEIALHAAETGHLVISTMHTGSASQTVQRYLDFFPGESGDVARAILAKMLVMVICQKLLPRCDTGGRIATFEIMINNSATKNLILKERWQDLDNSIDVGTQHGNISFARHIAMLVQEGVVDPAFLKDVKTT